MTEIKLNLIKLKKKYKFEKDLKVKYLSTINNPKNNSLLFCIDLNEDIFNKLKKISNSLIIISQNSKLNIEIEKKNFIIYTRNPKY